MSSEPNRYGARTRVAESQKVDPRQSSVESTSPASGGRNRQSILFLILLVGVVLAAVFGAERLLGQVPSEPASGPQFSNIARGLFASFLVAVVVIWYLSVRREPPFASGTGALSSSARMERVRRHAEWFVAMRWVAVAVSLALILIAVLMSGVLPLDSLPLLLGWWALLGVANVWFARRLPWVYDLEKEIMLQAGVDLVVLTGWLNASGGTENPFYQIYLLHVIIAGILLPKRKALLVAVMACSLVSFLSLGEYLRIIPHVTIAVFPHSHDPAVERSEEATDRIDHNHEEGEAGAGPLESGTPPRSDEGPTQHAALDPIFLLGRMVPFLTTLTLVAYLTTMIAERLRRSEAELEEAGRLEALERRRLEGIIHSAGIGVILIDPDLTVRWYSGRADEWLGLTRDSIGQKCCQGEDDELGCASLVPETVNEGQPMETEMAVNFAPGEIRHFRHATWPVLDAQGRVQQVVKLIEDVTARKALEAEAVHAGKLSALGKMSAAVAHEINNPLASLASRIALMERSEDPRFLRESTKVLRGQIARIGGIVHTVSQFGRAPTKKRSTWSVNAAVEEALNVVKLDPRAAKVRFDWKPGPPALSVTAVRDQILQACLNILINAVEATPDGGLVTIRVLTVGGEVSVSVRDTGDGIDPAVKEHLFEPFTTTKPTGTGIGLSISQSLVRAEGGRIEVKSEPGKGSCFTVLLPQASPEPRAARRRGASSTS